MSIGKFYGMFVEMTDNGSSVSHKVKKYDTYDQMVQDQEPTTYGIVDNVVYHNVDGEWVVGFNQIERQGEYTAFEVYPTSKTYEVGEFNVGGWTNSIAVDPCDSHHFIVRSIYSKEEQNVVIDWGDGNVTDLRNDIENIKVNGSYGSWNFIVRHKYDILDKPYIVKIYGDTYFGFMGETSANFIEDGTNDEKTYLKHNLMSRVFTRDLPVASCVSNAASCCRYGRRLLSVNVYGHPIVRQATNWTLAFSGCINMRSAWGFQDDNLNISACSEIFSNCKSMAQTDFKIPRSPRSSSTANTLYKECNELQSSVVSLLESTDFFVTPFKIGSMFYKTKVTMTAEEAETVGAKLWNNPKIEFLSTTNCFKGCSAEVRALVPTTWGGTKVEETAE